MAEPMGRGQLGTVVAGCVALLAIGAGCGSNGVSAPSTGDSGTDAPSSREAGHEDVRQTHDSSAEDVKGRIDGLVRDAVPETAVVNESGIDAAGECSDGVKDGNETGVDCGGPQCDALGKTCPVGQGCIVNEDCASGDGCNTATHRCDPNGCHDGVKDGSETDVDCGGTTCDAAGDTCPVTAACLVDADCTTGACAPGTHTCAATTCSDGVKDGNETGVDCGGPVCDPLGDTCGLGGGCLVDRDCTSKGCDATTHVCVATQCSDGMQNGEETGVDCGGSVCDALGDTCGVGVGCATDADCTSGGCDASSHQCDATRCHDGIQDGEETGVDCGGPVCDAAGYTCAIGVACAINSDCASGSCCGAQCTLTSCASPFSATPDQQTSIDDVASAVTGTAGKNTISLATPVGFAAGQTLMLLQVQGTGYGQWETVVITELSGGTATLAGPIAYGYSSIAPSTAEAVVVPQYTSFDVPTGATVTAPAWNGTTGGVLVFQASGAVTIEGTLTMASNGFRGFSHSAACLPALACSLAPNPSAIDGLAGESVVGPATESMILPSGLGQASANGGGGGTSGQDCAAGGGGGYATAGAQGTDGDLGMCLATPTHGGGQGGAPVGVATLTSSLVYGGAGGEGGPDEDGAYPGAGGNGGGAIVIFAPQSVTVTGSITASGGVGGDGVVNSPTCGGEGCGMGGGGGGAGGSILIETGTATLGTALVQSTGGTGGACTCGPGYPGGLGGDGFIQVSAASLTGTTTPAASP